MSDDGLQKIDILPPVSEPPPSPNEPEPPKAKTPSIPPTTNQLNTGKTKMKQSKKGGIWLSFILFLVIIIAGIGTGYALTQITGKGGGGDTKTTAVPTDPNAVKENKTYGEANPTTFPDTVTGVLVKGGIEGEGSHHLLRVGGPTKNVYLTSSVLDLDTFVNSEVEVRGQTFNAQKAGWLMDVGSVKVIKLNAEKPFEETPPAGIPTE